MTQRARLCEATLERVPADVERPGYDRRALAPGVVHIGPGAFHRAHQAVVFDDIARLGDLRWGITGLSLRSAAAREALEPQDGLFTLVVQDGARTARRVIGALTRVIALAGSPHPLVEAMASSATHLITLSVTEAGYVAPSRRGPATAAGLLAVALMLRRARSLPGLTILSCDNLSGNGKRLRGLVRQTADAFDPGLADWIDDNVAFPSTMVDRITPAPREQDVEALASHTGLIDRAVVRTERFSQWVIEDRFAGPRPAFEAAGVQLTRDVTPFERAKLRLLNGAHSAMAYLGGLGGVTFVHQFVRDPAGGAFLERLWDEVGPTLTPAPGLDVEAYRAVLMQRFSEPAIEHRLCQIAIDGSQKLPQRLIAPLAERLERERASPALILAVAAWMKWQSGRTDDGGAFEVQDPLSAAIRRRLAKAAGPADRAAALISMEQIFPASLAGRAGAREALSSALASLDAHGAAAAMRAIG